MLRSTNTAKRPTRRQTFNWLWALGRYSAATQSLNGTTEIVIPHPPHITTWETPQEGELGPLAGADGLSRLWGNARHVASEHSKRVCLWSRNHIDFIQDRSAPTLYSDIRGANSGRSARTPIEQNDESQKALQAHTPGVGHTQRSKNTRFGLTEQKALCCVCFGAQKMSTRCLFGASGGQHRSLNQDSRWVSFSFSPPHRQ